MNRRKRRRTTLGVLLILIGTWFLAVEFYAPLGDWADAFAEWPIWIVAVGVLFLVAALVGGVPDLVIPAAIISGIGGILYYQNATDEWSTWAYAWALIPGFVGVGVFIAKTLKGQFKRAFRDGGSGIISSLIVFVVLGSIFQPIVGGPQVLFEMRTFWPILLILLGLWMLVRPIFRRRQQPKPEIV